MAAMSSRQVIGRGSAISRWCVSSRAVSPVTANGNGWYHRYLSTNVVETELPESKEYKRAVYKLNRNIFGRFWDWLHTDLEQDDYEMSETEKQEREVLLQKIQGMYFAKPPVAPDLAVYKDVFKTLVKYNDKNGVETIWRLMAEMNIEPDAELEALVNPFLKEAGKKVWFD